MKNYLKSFYLQGDTEMQTLTKSAHSNFILKLLYLRRKHTKFVDLYEDYRKGLGADSIAEEEVRAILDELYEKKLVRFQDDFYYLSTNRIERIDKARAASEDRKRNVVATYFCQVYSTPEQILEWLDDVLIFFFDSYSSEWVSDLYYNKNYIRSSKEGLLKAIERRTQNSKLVEKRDRAILPDKFLSMLLAPNDSDVNQLLWEYGTTAFSAKLISSTHGANPVTLDTFRGSICLLDTNILMNIGLEEGNYYKTLSSLEKVYERLGIMVKILPITRDEYLYTMQNIKNDVIRLVSKGYSDEVLKQTGDRYIRTAIERKCETEEDYELFFEELLQVPTAFHEKLAIEIEDSDNVLESVAQSQADEKKIDSLGALHLTIHTIKKATHSLIHDVGLIAGVEEMRKTKKSFILSQDSTISAYSKQRPVEQGLTLSIKMETLINVLALDSGGAEVDPQNYIPLFAQMIRHGLSPDEKTFQIQDLTRMSEMEQEITRLDDRDIIKLATDIATLRMQGESEEQIGLTFRRELQDVKKGIVDELEDTKRNMENERMEKERYRQRSDKGEKALEAEVRDRVRKKYNSKLWFKLAALLSGVFVIPCLLILLNFLNSWLVFDESWRNVVMSVGGELVAAGITCFIVKPWRLIEDYRERKVVVDNLVKQELSNYYEV